MYSIYSYGRMIADSSRMRAYASALRRTVKPDSVVADLGAGTGIFSLLACQLGARRVFAVEPSDSIQLARQIAEANGYADRIEFFQEYSTKVTLPERADIIVSDMRGMLPVYQNHIPSIIDARTRMLGAGGTLIPLADSLRVSVVEAPGPYEQFANPWSRNEYGLDLTPGRKFAFNTWSRERVEYNRLLVQPRTWATLNYMTVESPDVGGDEAWTVEVPGTAHGLLLWFDAQLSDGVGFTNSPDGPESVYGSSFWPWLEPVDLEGGDSISIRLAADLVGDDYIWRWETAVRAKGGGIKADFKQSSFHSMLLFPVHLRRRAEDYIPRLNEEGRIRRLIFDLMDGETELSEIALRIRQEFPGHFGRPRDALELVRQVSQRYSL